MDTGEVCLEKASRPAWTQHSLPENDTLVNLAPCRFGVKPGHLGDKDGTPPMLCVQVLLYAFITG